MSTVTVGFECVVFLVINLTQCGCGNVRHRLPHVEALEAFDARLPDNDWSAKPVDRAALLGLLVDAILAIDAPRPLSRLIDHALSCCDKYDLTDAHLAAIFALESRLARLPAPDQVITHWLATCRRKLEERTAQAPQKPTDYRRSQRLSCSCSDCRELSRFLVNPDRRQHRFPIRKNRRRHLHEIIDTDRCDLTHVTERSGRPLIQVAFTAQDRCCRNSCKASQNPQHAKNHQPFLGFAAPGFRQR